MGFLKGLRSPKRSPTNKVQSSASDAIQQVQIGSKGAVVPAEAAAAAGSNSKKKNAVQPQPTPIQTARKVGGPPAVPVKSPTVVAAIQRSNSPVKRAPQRMNKCIEKFTQGSSAAFALTPKMLEEKNNKDKPAFAHERSVLHHLCFQRSSMSASINSTQFERRISVLNDLEDPKTIADFIFEYLCALSGQASQGIDVKSCAQKLSLSTQEENSSTPGNVTSKVSFAKDLLEDPEIVSKMTQIIQSKLTEEERAADNTKSDWAAAWESVDRKKQTDKK
jgi:hypothetical protein